MTSFYHPVLACPGCKSCNSSKTYCTKHKPGVVVRYFRCDSCAETFTTKEYKSQPVYFQDSQEK